MFELFIIIMVGSIAWRGSSVLSLASTLEKPLWTSQPVGSLIISIYTLLALPLALLNGYLLNGFRGLIISGIGTLLGKGLINNLFSGSLLFQKFPIHSPTIQFVLFGAIYIILTIRNIIL